MVAEILLNNGRFAKTRAFDIAYKIKEYASNCVSGVDEKSEYVNALTNSFNKIQSLKGELENINSRLDNLLRKSIPYQLLKTVPGVGENLLIQMSAEIGDYTRFKTAKQFN
jgi:transposase